MPLLTLYIKLSLLAGGLGNIAARCSARSLVVFFLESTRFIMPLIPGITAVQGAALRELMISVALLIILRFYAKGLIPERIEHPALPAVVTAASAPART